MSKQAKTFVVAATPKGKKTYETEVGECGHQAPVKFMVYDQDGNGCCPRCVHDELISYIKKLKRVIRDQRAVIRKLK